MTKKAQKKRESKNKLKKPDVYRTRYKVSELKWMTERRNKNN